MAGLMHRSDYKAWTRRPSFVILRRRGLSSRIRLIGQAEEQQCAGIATQIAKMNGRLTETGTGRACSVTSANV